MVNIMTWYGGMVKLFLVDRGCHLSRSLCKTDFKFMLSEFATEPTDPPILNNPWSTSVLYISYFENNDLFIYIVTFWKLELSARFKACINHRIAASFLRVSVWKGCPTHPFFYTRPTRPFFYPSFYNNHAVTIATSESLTLSPVSLLYYIWCQKKERILPLGQISSSPQKFARPAPPPLLLHALSTKVLKQEGSYIKLHIQVWKWLVKYGHIFIFCFSLSWNLF